MEKKQDLIINSENTTIDAGKIVFPLWIKIIMWLYVLLTLLNTINIYLLSRDIAKLS